MTHASIQEIRPAFHAGTLYPAEREFLGRVVDGFLAGKKSAQRSEVGGIFPKAIIAPHGGYVYSGEVAGSAFAAWRGAAVRRVVLVGPSHTYDFPGIALPDTSIFTTPLGELHVDVEAAEIIQKFSYVRRFEAAHHAEFTVEVQLPFIQRLFGEPTIVPLITGQVDSRHVAALINSLWGGSETVFVISSDLSRCHEASLARKIDANTARAIQEFRYGVVTVDQACGYRAIRGFLQAALKREMRCVLAELRNSGDVESADDVTGYGAFHFFEF